MLRFLVGIATMIDGHTVTTGSLLLVVDVDKVSAANCCFRHCHHRINRTFKSVVTCKVDTSIAGYLVKAFEMMNSLLNHGKRLGSPKAIVLIVKFNLFQKAIAQLKFLRFSYIAI
jgi:predicted phosphatase